MNRTVETDLWDIDKYTHVHGLRLNIVNLAVLPKLSTDCEIPLKPHLAFFCRN